MILIICEAQTAASLRKQEHQFSLCHTYSQMGSETQREFIIQSILLSVILNMSYMIVNIMQC